MPRFGGAQRGAITRGPIASKEFAMTEIDEKTRTELVIEKIEYNIGLTADDFSRRELERGSR